MLCQTGKATADFVCTELLQLFIIYILEVRAKLDLMQVYLDTDM